MKPTTAPTLMPLTSRVVSIAELFSIGAYGPAAVQRDYQWRAEECSILLADLDRVFSASSFAVRDDDEIVDDGAEANALREIEIAPVDDELRVADLLEPPHQLDDYMLGSIVVTPPDKGLRLVYDGLQRMTTLTVLAAVLRDMTPDEALRDFLDSLIRLDEKSFRLTLAGKDTTLSRQIQPKGESIRPRRGEPQSDMGSRIRVAAGVFREGIKSWSDARRDAFAHFLLTRVRLILVEAYDPRLARQIFVTTNMRGKNLNRVDLLKGQLVDIADNEESARQVVAHWNGARNACGDQFEELLVAVDFIERRQPQGDDCLNELADYIQQKRGPAGIEAWVQKLTHHAGAWRELRAFLQNTPTDEFSADIWRLQLFKWDNWQPLALLWLSDYRRAVRQGGPGAPQKIAAAQRRFAALHRRCLAIALAGFSNADRERIFGRAISQVNRDLNPLASSGALAFNPQQLARIGETLRLPLMDKDLRICLIRWLETMHMAPGQEFRISDMTVEHVLPRRPPDGSHWVVDFPEPDERFLACHALGNLAALDKGRNERVSNNSFAEKRAIYETAAGEFNTLRDVVTVSEWSGAAIEARTERLADEVIRYLDLPPAFSRG